MPVVQVDYDLIGRIVGLKEIVKVSVDGSMEGRLTAGHLASDVYALLEVLDTLEGIWKESAQAAAPQAEQPPQESEQPSQESEQPPQKGEQPPQEGGQPSQKSEQSAQEGEQPPPEGEQ